MPTPADLPIRPSRILRLVRLAASLSVAALIVGGLTPVSSWAAPTSHASGNGHKGRTHKPSRASGGRNGETPAEPSRHAPAEPGGNAPAEPGGQSSLPVGARGEGFAGQPAAVLLTYSHAVSPSDAAQCVGVSSSGGLQRFGGIAQGPTSQTIQLELVPGGAMPAKIQCAPQPEGPGLAAKSASKGGEDLTVSPAAPSAGGVMTDPIDPSYLTQLPFGKTSFWVQPWRAYLETRPASGLGESLGVNFNIRPPEAETTARLLHDSGFTLARRELPWDSLSYADPTKFREEASVDTILSALHKNGLRPLLLLNANAGDPAPSIALNLETTSATPAGARAVHLTRASAASVVAGKTGFNGLSFGGSPDTLITRVTSAHVGTLSRPLSHALRAGAHLGTTLLYAPFTSPLLPNGAANPAFQATLQGWLSYVSTVSKKAASIFGPGGYDLEVWNELTFGSQFLNAEHYYLQNGAGNPAVSKPIRTALLDATVSFVRNPSNGISPNVGISDGFASESPFPSGVQPLGLTALSKHPYHPARSYPSPQTKRHSHAGSGGTRPFTPTFQSDLPEYFLTGISTETLVRDLSPFKTSIYGTPHGREVGPPGGRPVQKWITEYNLGSLSGTPVGPDEVTPDSSVRLAPADRAHFEAKALLRSLVAMVSSGISREYFYAAAPGPLGLISPSFVSAERANPGSYPGDQFGGETMTGFRNMLNGFRGPGPGGAPRQIKLLSIAQSGNHAQFSGNGTAAYPNLYDRDVLAVFPFQSSPTRFVIPVYDMTRDLFTVYSPNAPSTDVHRFDLPDETFRITLGNLPETENAPAVGAYDPLRNESTPAQLISRAGNTAVFQFAATDYPRLLTIEYPTK